MNSTTNKKTRMFHMLPEEIVLHIFSYLKDEKLLQTYCRTFRGVRDLMVGHPRVFFSFEYLHKNKVPYDIIKAHTRGSASHTLVLAARHNYHAQVAALLKDKDCDPTLDENRALCDAIKENHIKVVRHLLSDARVKGWEYDNVAIRMAIEYDRGEITELLLRDERVDPCTDNDSYVYYAIELCHYDVVKVLLGDYRVHPSMDDNELLYFTTELGNARMVRLIISNRRFIRMDRYDDCIRIAISRRHLDVVGVLLEHTGYGYYNGKTVLQYFALCCLNACFG
jgi:hypothetical protein